MPPLLGLLGTIGGFIAANAPAITAASALAGAGASIGNTIYQDVSQPSTQDMAKLLQQSSQQPGGQQAPTQQQIEQNVAQARQGATDTQANLGGALAPGFLEQIAQSVNPQSPGYGLQGVQQLFGQTG